LFVALWLAGATTGMGIVLGLGDLLLALAFARWLTSPA
jgi:hypothetical protein